MQLQIFIVLLVCSASNALFFPLIYKALGLEPAPTVVPAESMRLTPGYVPTPPPLQQQPPSAQYAVFRTQQLVQPPWYPSSWRGMLPYPSHGYIVPQVQAEVPISPGEVQKIDESEIENAPIIVGSGYAFHQQ